MNEIEIPILKKTCDLYKCFNECRTLVPKQSRYGLYEKCDVYILEMLEKLLSAGYGKSLNKQDILELASSKLNLIRFLIRLLKDTKSIDSKKYIILQVHVDEIGRMLGGWIRSTIK